MKYGERLKSSFTYMRHSPSLLSVMILEFILGVTLGVLFFLGNLAIIVYLNRNALVNLDPNALDITAFINIAFNAKTIMVLSIVLLLQGVIFVYLDSFFKAGFFGMLKNAIHDGTTTLHEFLPEAKHYWYAMFRFLLLRYAIMALFAIPFLIALLFYVGTTPEFVTTAQAGWLLGTFLLFIIAVILIFFWFFYGEAVIVFEDASAMQAVRDSARITNQHLGITTGSLLTVIVLITIATVLENVLGMPFEYLGTIYGSAQLFTDSVKFFLNIITISAGIIASIFIFLTYDHLTTARGVRKPMMKMVSRKPIKRKA